MYKEGKIANNTLYKSSLTAALSESHDLCISGDCFEMLQRTEAVLQVIPYVKVFARVAPEQKELVLTTFKTVGRMTLMCGDGTNDVGALKQAVGEMSTASEMQPLAPAGYRRAPEMKEKVEASAVDLEAGTGETLYPGISHGESALRWGFVRKVYGILAAQLLLTTAVSAVTVLQPTLNATLSASPGLALALAVLPFVLMIPLYHYQHKHPHNFVFLGLFTLCLSFSIGVACANTQGKIVLEALILTSAVVASLTGYTFWASKKGKEFGYLGPFLFSGLILLVLTSFIQIFFPLGTASVALFGGLGALVFSGFILYDTENLIRRHTYDEYIWASVGLYLDILNLFLSILNMLRSMQSDS